MAAWPSNRGKPASGALSGNIDADTVAATVGQLRATAIAEERAEQMTRILARLEDGLYLRLNVLLRSAHWTFRYTSQAHGRRHDLGLGGYPRVSVQTARARWNATTPHCRTWRFRASYSRCATSRGQHRGAPGARVHGTDRGAHRRDVGCHLGRSRLAGARVARPRHTHEIATTASRAADRCHGRILQAAEVLRDGRYVFPTPMGHDKPLSNMSLLMCLRRMGYGAKTTVHGFRASFSTWARENTRLRVDTIDAALAHRDEDKTARAYSHATAYWTERRQLAEQWAAFCTTAPKAAASVLRLRR